jgi:dihydroxyacetone kinase-like protein
MKKFINRPEDVVSEALQGMAGACAGLVKVHFSPDYILRADAPVAGKVALVSGGGSGHEPLHGGFVGPGMLDAAVPGAVFTSPTPDQIQAATLAVHGGAGVLHIIKNYTGDVLNFEMAADLVQAEGIPVEAVVINDDVAVQDSLYTAGRRGTGVTLIAEKIAGAAAEQGRPLTEVAALCRKVNANGRSMGVALTSCTAPQSGSPTFALAEDEMEIGVGIHGEPGRSRGPMQPAAAATALMAIPILEDLPFRPGDRVLALVNGLGGTPAIELYIVYHELAKLCAARGVTIVRSLVGTYMTSLDMAGCTITLVRMDDELVSLWDAPVKTTALRWGA